jgi:acyl-CoA thioesterase
VSNDQRTAEIFAERDRFAQLLGMEILESRHGYGKVMLEIRDEHLNIYSSVHGGVIMSLADHAFGVVVTGIAQCIGVQWSINITRAPRRGDTLYAESNVLHLGSRTVVCDMSVRDSHERLVATGIATALVLGSTAEEAELTTVGQAQQNDLEQGSREPPGPASERRR